MDPELMAEWGRLFQLATENMDKICTPAGECSKGP
jgi:hypothetical protein